jgi:hypothetical protein
MIISILFSSYNFHTILHSKRLDINGHYEPDTYNFQIYHKNRLNQVKSATITIRELLSQSGPIK